MLIYERKRDFVCVEQHNHAILSGDLFSHWRDDLFVGNRREDVLFAIRNHDRAWITLDGTPFWNDGESAPYSFIDMPGLLKIPHYQSGVDWVERRNKYASLLCSQHYSSFFYDPNEDLEQAYYEYELERQKYLRDQIGGLSEGENNNHLHILQFCDKLSIYVCVNEPGVSKSDEFSWYRDGFAKSEHLVAEDGGKIVAHWLGEGYVGLTLFPFTQNFQISVPTKIVSKHAIQEHGVARAYNTTPITVRNVEIGPIPMQTSRS